MGLGKGGAGQAVTEMHKTRHLFYVGAKVSAVFTTIFNLLSHIYFCTNLI